MGFDFEPNFQHLFSSIPSPHPNTHTPYGVLYFVTRLVGWLIGAYNPMLQSPNKLKLLKNTFVRLDEISPSAPTDVWEVTAEGEIKEYQICPADFGLATHAIEHVSGGTAEERVR